MQFELDPSEQYKHGIVLQAAEDEVETVASMYRERVNLKARAGNLDEIEKHERQFSMWSGTSDRTIFTNFPVQIAQLLEQFHKRTEQAVQEIIQESHEPLFDSDAIARRMELGDKAFQLAGLIKLEYDHDTLHQMLDDQGVDLFRVSEEIREQPSD